MRAKMRGVTLAEMCVVIAVVMVAVTMAVSFSVIAVNSVKLSRDRLNAQNDISIAESVLNGWLNVMSESGAEFTPTTNAEELTAEIDGETYVISFKNGAISGNLPDGKSIEAKTEHIFSVDFSSLVRENNSDIIVFCTVNCSLRKSSQTQEISYTFCCNSHVADVIIGGAGQ